ncbi:tRNA U-34 5-methylaminomethyl-2-thiouridine biosynthesis protein [Sporosarcina sp. ACRSL]|uniref:tRNA U-34 5-methylaminomethyl-2-thiouridine biosynthesis protein n=1 Tax=Sporosarcina sp. ACRSL TaxID=2918215 RepID=UPI001EF5E81A|nr:tRNA U-34 5-methylaminomethyl-2-thiouridine biosynthesis protein [Sporosarcina sp. ACRSL]MCG7344751.1 tRNA U-34 5-methylaminomethyl-2-thiouridine biosynthesis protein [Sporosarcina sp. ACRSL]
MFKSLFLLFAGILVAFFVFGFFTDNYDWEYLFIFSFGVLIGYVVKKKEVDD